ncbi:hypothetical protein TNCV_4079101 [Trichonephila clavipes]|nr:hypothetical protein TNCV_4079101 [Trichonephila clavipes]
MKKQTEVVFSPPVSPNRRHGKERSECLNQIHKEEKSFVKEKEEKLASSPVEKQTKKQKNSANSSSATAKSRSEYMKEYRAQTIKAWLQYLVATPLYRMYDVTIDDSFFNLNQSTSQVPQEKISENITIEESLTAQQQTLLWNEEKFRIALLKERMYQEACYLMNMLRSSLSLQFIWVI